MKGKPPDFAVLAVSFTNDRLRKGVRNRLRGQLRPKIGPHLAAGDMTVGFTPIRAATFTPVRPPGAFLARLPDDGGLPIPLVGRLSH
jgi:hypothetical protein